MQNQIVFEDRLKLYVSTQIGRKAKYFVLLIKKCWKLVLQRERGTSVWAGFQKTFLL